MEDEELLALVQATASKIADKLKPYVQHLQFEGLLSSFFVVHHTQSIVYKRSHLLEPQEC